MSSEIGQVMHIPHSDFLLADGKVMGEDLWKRAIHHTAT